VSGDDTSSSAGVLRRLRDAALFPRKSLGQHFLHDPRLLASIAREAELTLSSHVFEVGMGPATLTRQLATNAARVLTVEVDERMAAFARRELEGFENVEILERDALDGHGKLASEVLESLAALGPFSWVANLPYAVAAPLILGVLESGLPWEIAVLTVQLEFGERLAATCVVPPERGGGGSKKRQASNYGGLSVLVSAFAEVELVRRVPPGAFAPPPKVDSAVVRLRPRRDAISAAAAEYEQLRRWVHELFRARRKQLGGLLRAAIGPEAAERAVERGGWSVRWRPENLELGDFLLLAREFPLEIL